MLVSYAKALGVPSKALRTTGWVVNTAEEAQAGVIRGGRRSYRGNRNRWKSSPWRFVAVAVFVGAAAAAKVSLFERVGLTVMAYPVDFQGEASRNLSVMDFVPRAGAFKKPKWLGEKPSDGCITNLKALRLTNSGTRC